MALSLTGSHTRSINKPRKAMHTLKVMVKSHQCYAYAACHQTMPGPTVQQCALPRWSGQKTTVALMTVQQGTAAAVHLYCTVLYIPRKTEHHGLE